MAPLGQNEMKPSGGMPLRVRLSDVLGVAVRAHKHWLTLPMPKKLAMFLKMELLDTDELL